MNHYETLVQVAKWYYLDGLMQAEIAKKIKKSRSMVSKLIAEARNQGIVEIRIAYPLDRDRALEDRIREHLMLDAVRVVQSLPSEDLNRVVLAKTAAEFLAAQLRDRMILGLAWSRTVKSVVDEFSGQTLRDAIVVQLSGSAGSEDPGTSGIETIREMAQKLKAAQWYFPAPLVVRSPDAAQVLVNEPAVQQSIAYAKSCDLAVVGIGSVDRQRNSLVASKLISAGELQEFTRLGSVGDILAHQLDVEGSKLDHDFNRRVIGLDIDELVGIPRVIAVAAGGHKAPAIRAASAGAYITDLVTDTDTAAALLDLAAVTDKDANDRGARARVRAGGGI